ncbi:hypothetical protein [Shimia sagamensis]|uniref:Uncharacterized protein n=1 Tax=Shimia sagamensis TaxID=1566352 RepID=A0ABY1NYJ9_9RHOB|nr:hypothetical protein [Shimia sagamensis]SMP22096.1 hypothetical protein SAMN06265373_104111 [Shimia sagamensis]
MVYAVVLAAIIRRDAAIFGKKIRKRFFVAYWVAFLCVMQCAAAQHGDPWSAAML